MRFETKESLVDHLAETVSYWEVNRDKRDLITIRTVKFAICDEKVWMVKQRLRNDDVESEYILVCIMACVNGNWIDIKSYKEPQISYKTPYFLDCPTDFFSDNQDCIRELWRNSCREGFKFKVGKQVFLGKRMCVISSSPLVLKDESGKRIKISDNLVKFIVK